MNDTQAIAAEIANLSWGKVVSHGCARMIAAGWHDGQGSALYALTSTGAILSGALREIDATLAMVERGMRQGTYGDADVA